MNPIADYVAKTAQKSGAKNMVALIAHSIATCFLCKTAVEAEREACAQVCEGRNRDGDWFAAEIRARSKP